MLSLSRENEFYQVGFFAFFARGPKYRFRNFCKVFLTNGVALGLSGGLCYIPSKVPHREAVYFRLLMIHTISCRPRHCSSSLQEKTTLSNGDYFFWVCIRFAKIPHPSLEKYLFVLTSKTRLLTSRSYDPSRYAE